MAEHVPAHNRVSCLPPLLHPHAFPLAVTVPIWGSPFKAPRALQHSDGARETSLCSRPAITKPAILSPSEPPGKPTALPGCYYPPSREH